MSELKRGIVIAFPTRKICSHYEIRAADDAWGWVFRHVFTDGTVADFPFSFEEAENMATHFRAVTVDRLA
jgi:hypothetical protein